MTPVLTALMLGLSSPAMAEPSESLRLAELAPRLEIGDLVFIRIPALPFRLVAKATLSWTNHVGVVVEVVNGQPMIGESTVPFSRVSPLSRFVARSERGRVAVSRLPTPLTEAQRRKLADAVKARSGVLYDSGFDIASRRQFCSRYVREVVGEATGVELGEVESFATLLHRNPTTDLTFWRIWYFGVIPWQRRTVTPASLLEDPRLVPVFDGRVEG
jgi:ribosomal protein S18